MQRFTVLNRTKGTVVAQSAGLADNYFTRLRGLMGTRTLQPGEGLIIRPCNSIHTFFMRFPIEVLFVDEGNRVLRATDPIAPWRIGPIVPKGRYVVELPAGTLADSHTTSRDVLELVPVGTMTTPEDKP